MVPRTSQFFQMRAFHFVGAARRGVLTAKQVPFRRNINVIPSFSFRSVRHHSSSNEPETPTQWTQHTLTGTPPPISDTITLTQTDAPRIHRAYIALGSNLGEKVGWIEKACNEMSVRGIKVKRTSSLWETNPMYVVDQDVFVNGACEVETTLEPLALLDELQSIENALGRVKVIDKGPRNIDLDILLYDDEVIDHERLKIPHPGIFEREFVLRPLAELIPGKALDPASPWKVTQDYLNALPPSTTSLSTLTPLGLNKEPIRALKSDRQTHVMAIFNVTTDSFSDGGEHLPSTKTTRSPRGDNRIYTLNKFIKNGATIIDIGGQSTAPGAKDVPVELETERVLEAISLLQDKNILISVDTFRAHVAEAAVRAGAHIINDVSAGALDPEMLPTMARLGSTVCLMHMRGTPQTMMEKTDYSPDGLIPTVAKELLERVAAAEEAGIRRWRIILDPGIGFAKTVEQNLELLRRLDELRDWPGLRGLPWLVGTSRKSFIRKILGVKTINETLLGTGATVAAAIQGGADIVRVHDVSHMAKVAKVTDAIWRV